MKMLITYISFQCEDVDAGRECVKGVCIYMGEDPGMLIREYVVCTCLFFSFFSDFPQCVILLTWHEMTNMASFLQGMEERAINETVEDTTVRIYLLKEQASAEEQELSLQASGWRRIWIM